MRHVGGALAGVLSSRQQLPPGDALRSPHNGRQQLVARSVERKQLPRGCAGLAK